MKRPPGPWEAYVAVAPVFVVLALIGLVAAEPGPMAAWQRVLSFSAFVIVSTACSALLEEVCSWYDQDHDV